MDPMALLQYQFLMAKAAEYRAIAARQAMIANAAAIAASRVSSLVPKVRAIAS